MVESAATSVCLVEWKERVLAAEGEEEALECLRVDVLARAKKLRLKADALLHHDVAEEKSPKPSQKVISIRSHQSAGK